MRLKLFVLLWLLSSFRLFSMQQSSDISEHKTDFIINSDGAIIELYSSLDLNKLDENISRIVVAIQCHYRQAPSRFKAVLEEAKKGDMEEKLLVLVPHFKIPSDGTREQEPYWNSAGWKQGDLSKDESQLSSFGVLDEIIRRIMMSGNFPALAEIIISGHSAGGQFTQRYALTSQIVQEFPQINFSFLVLNPSSYTYLNKKRPHPLKAKKFSNPNLRGQIRQYNNYKYGLENRNSYSSSLDEKQMRKEYLKRNVYYILGENDSDPKHLDLDTSRAAMLQGTNRFSRGMNFVAHLKKYYPKNRHYLITVAGVGHEAKKMYAAEPVRQKLFMSQMQP